MPTMRTQQPTIALLVMTDGRDHLLEQTIASARENLRGNIVEQWIHADGQVLMHADYLDRQYPDFVQIPPAWPAGTRRGFGGAIDAAWRCLARHSTADYVFHLEDDFTFNRPVDLDAIAEVLASTPDLAQMALRRQAWNDAERAAGGVIEQHPDAYTQMVYGDPGRVSRMAYWLEHTLFFTTNPCLYPRRGRGHGQFTVLDPWPTGPESEGRYGIRLREAGYRFGFWGRREDAPWVHHIGETRVGRGY